MPRAGGWILGGAVAAAGVLLAAGCDSAPKAGPPPGSQLTAHQVVTMPLSRNVTGVAAFYAPYNPWIWNEERSRVRGIVVNALYLIGPDSLGVFGDGVIHPKIYELARSPDEREMTPRLVKEWSFDPDQAMPFRAKKRTAMGWGYKVFLPWGDDVDLAGKDIRITISFERRDGKVFHSGKKEFKVPARGG